MQTQYGQFEDGFGQSTMAELAELRKALEITPSNPAAVTGADSLRVESLDSTLKLITFMSTHLRLWNAIPKTPAFSTVEEYNRLEEYGAEANSGFVQSGELPEEEDTTYSRQSQAVKYIGSTRSVHHPATLIRTVPADLIATETQNGALYIAGKANRALYFGDASIVPDEWNGISRQIVAGSGHTIDLRGQPLDQDDIEDAAELVIENYGLATQFYSNPRVFSDFSKAFHTLQRFAVPTARPGVVGTPVTGYATQNGDIMFNPDTFVRDNTLPPPSVASARAPTAPTIGSFVVAGGPVAGSLFGAADVGDYLYKVSAVNRFGESLPSAASAAQTVTTDDSVSFTITDGGGADTSTGYKIYRTKPDGTTYYFIRRIARAGATTPVVDLNADLPDTFKGLMLDVNEQSLTFRQLSPMIRMPLAVIAPAIRWMQLLYGSPVVFAPKKNVYFKNVGKAT